MGDQAGVAWSTGFEDLSCQSALPLPPRPPDQADSHLGNGQTRALILQIRPMLARLILTHESKDFCPCQWQKQVGTSDESVGK